MKIKTWKTFNETKSQYKRTPIRVGGRDDDVYIFPEEGGALLYPETPLHPHDPGLSGEFFFWLEKEEYEKFKKGEPGKDIGADVEITLQGELKENEETQTQDEDILVVANISIPRSEVQSEKDEDIIEWIKNNADQLSIEVLN